MSSHEINPHDVDAFAKEVEKKINEVATKNKKKSRNGKNSKLCFSCNKIFQGGKDFKTHVCSIQCNVCGKSLKSEKLLQEHLLSLHSIGKKLKCELCEDEVYDMRKHIGQFHHEKQSCLDCGKAVKNMKYHIQTIHGPPVLKRFICEVCEKRFLFKEKLEAHKKVHSDEKEYVCKFKCGHAARTLGNIKKHESSIRGCKSFRKAKGDQEYYCKFKCGYGANQMGNVKHHESYIRACEKFRKRSIRKAESIIKEYGMIDPGLVKVDLMKEDDPLLINEKTTLGEKGVNYRENLHHTETNVNPTDKLQIKKNEVDITDHNDVEAELDEGSIDDIIKEAEIMESKQITQPDAKGGTIKDENQRNRTIPYNCCPFCGKDFEKIEHHILVSHMGINIFQYNCKLCGKEFETKETLVVHKALHLNKTNYWCQFSCGFSIKSKTLLKVHEKNDHQINHIF